MSKIYQIFWMVPEAVKSTKESPTEKPKTDRKIMVIPIEKPHHWIGLCKTCYWNTPLQIWALELCVKRPAVQQLN